MEVKMSEIERKSLEKSLERTARKVSWILFWTSVVLTIFAFYYQTAVYYPHELEERHANWPDSHHPTYNAVKVDDNVEIAILLFAVFLVIMAAILQGPLNKLNERRKK
jgi:hypothetical protein